MLEAPNFADDDLDAPEMPLAFDDAGRPILVAHPVYKPPTDDDDRGIHLELVHATIDFINAGTTPQERRDRGVLLAFIWKTFAAPKTLRDLGYRLGCSHTAARTRLSMFRAQLCEELKDFTS